MSILISGSILHQPHALYSAVGIRTIHTPHAWYLDHILLARKRAFLIIVRDFQMRAFGVKLWFWAPPTVSALHLPSCSGSYN